MSWQEYLAKGDVLKQRATWDTSLEDMHSVWQQARDAYSQAESNIDLSESLQTARLYRELATCYRKLDDITTADKYLRLCTRFLNRIQSHSVDHSTLHIAKMLAKLESVFVSFAQERWEIVVDRSEEIIDQFNEGSNQQEGSDDYYILGCAYNLLAIALQHLGVEISASAKTPKQCWDMAENLLTKVQDERSLIVLGQIKLNQAFQWGEEGHCDLAIEQLDAMLDGRDIRLPTSSLIPAQRALASAYLDRFDSQDLLKTERLAENILSWAKRQKNVSEWFFALQIYLRFMHQKISVADEAQVDILLEQAQTEYRRLKQTLQLRKIQLLDHQFEDIEINRWLVECYLAAHLIDEAGSYLKHIQQHTLQETLRDNGDILLTSALYASYQFDISTAISDANRAWHLLKQANHQGRMIDADLLLMQLYVDQDNWSSAQGSIERAWDITQKLFCEARLLRVSALRQRVRQRDQTLQRSLPTALTEIRILMLAANPTDTNRLHWEKESKVIQETLLKARIPRQIRFHLFGAVSKHELQKWIRETQPTIVHFSGHGTGDSRIVLETEHGYAEFATAQALIDLFRLCKETIRCVVLNACSTDDIASQIAQHIDYVIGMSSQVEDDAAIAFAQSFYQSIATGQDFARAFDFGRNQLQMAYPDQAELPMLFTAKSSHGNLTPNRPMPTEQTLLASLTD